VGVLHPLHQGDGAERVQLHHGGEHHEGNQHAGLHVERKRGQGRQGKGRQARERISGGKIPQQGGGDDAHDEAAEQRKELQSLASPYGHADDHQQRHAACDDVARDRRERRQRGNAAPPGAFRRTRFGERVAAVEAAAHRPVSGEAFGNLCCLFEKAILGS